MSSDPSEDNAADLSPTPVPAPVPWSRRADDCLILRVRLTPKSARDQIEGIDMLSDGTAILKVRVRAQPQDGEANHALLRLLAKSLQIGLSAIRLESGATARVKTLVLTGDSALLAGRLTELAVPFASPVASPVANRPAAKPRSRPLTA